MEAYYLIDPKNLDRTPPTANYFRQAWAFCCDWAAGQNSFIRHTSGSTGAPKPIELSRNQFIASAKASQQALGLESDQTALVCLNINYIAGTMMLVRGMGIGLKMVVVEPSSDPLATLPADVSIDFAAFVPLQLQTMFENGHAARLNAFKTIIVGGAAVNATLAAQLQTFSAAVFSTYGMTETVSHVALQRLNGAEKSDFFQLLPKIETSTDERGCLRLRGAVSNHDWVQTNDVVEFIDNQHFKITGRADNIINSGGVKIQLEKVERAIEKVASELGLTNRFFAWHQPHDRLGQQLVLVVENSKNIPDLESLKTALTNELTPYEIPKIIISVEKFIETPTAKIDKGSTFAARLLEPSP